MIIVTIIIINSSIIIIIIIIVVVVIIINIINNIIIVVVTVVIIFIRDVQSCTPLPIKNYSIPDGDLDPQNIARNAPEHLTIRAAKTHQTNVPS